MQKQRPPYIFTTYKSRVQGIIMRPSSSLTFDTFPVVTAITTSRWELVEIVLRLPYVDRLVLRTADNVLAIVTTYVNRDSLTLYRRSIQSTVKQMMNWSLRKWEVMELNSAMFPLTFTSGYWSNKEEHLTIIGSLTTLCGQNLMSRRNLKKQSLWSQSACKIEKTS